MNDEIVSPFKRVHTREFKAEPTFYETYDIKGMPPKYKYAFGGILVSLMAMTFSLLLWTGYTVARREQFLSPLAGTTTNSKYCSTIPVSNTGQYYFTKNGYFAGQTGFILSNAAYYFDYTSLSISYTDYESLMYGLYSALYSLGEASAQQDLAFNLLLWFTYNANPTPDPNSIQRFYLVGDPLVVFDRNQMVGALSSLYGQCNATSAPSFNSATGVMSLSYSYSQLSSIDICSRAISPSSFGYLIGVSSDTFSIDFDVRSLVVAMSVNLKILTLSQLVQIPNSTVTFDADGNEYQTAQYYFTKFQGMDPILCVLNPSKQQCFVIIGQVIGLPVFNSVGASYVSAQSCNCSALTVEELSSPTAPCNLFNFLLGLLYFNSGNAFDPMFDLTKRYNYNFSVINQLVYNASFYASYFGQLSPSAPVFNTPEVREQLYEFCTFGNETCSLIMFTLGPGLTPNFAISSNYYQLLTGACQNAISPSRESWLRLVQNPFAPLVQQYQQCQDSPSTVMAAQLGIQFGNVSIAIPFIVIFVLTVAYLYQKLFGVDIPVAYTQADREEALHAFATTLLLARDRMIKGNATELEANSAMVQILQILEKDADLHGNLYKLKEEVEHTKVDWKQLMNKHQAILSPLQNALGYSFSGKNKDNLEAEASSTTSMSQSVELSTVENRSFIEKTINILNKSASEKKFRVLRIEDSADKDETAKKIDQLISKFEELLEIRKKDENLASQKYWGLLADCGLLKRIEVGDGDDTIESNPGEFLGSSSKLPPDIRSKIAKLLTLQGSFALNCEPETVVRYHANKIGYYVGKFVFTLDHLKST